MGFFSSPSDMFNHRANKSKNKADKEWADYKREQENGNSLNAREHFLSSQKNYKEEKINRDAANKYNEKSWNDLRK